PNDRKNLAYQAAALMMKTYHIKTGVNIVIEKNIPIAAGRAGGSSDAAATFRGMNELYGLGRPLEELADLSAELGSDIPFCVYGRTALCTGRGEKVELLPKPTNAWVILAKPSVGVSTTLIYSHLQPGKHDPASGKVVEAAVDGDYNGVVKNMNNDLEEVTIEHYQIGRASCRERVEMSEVAVSWKKREHEQQRGRKNAKRGRIEQRN